MTSTTVTPKRINVRKMTMTAMLAAVATVLMFFSFSVPLMPSFIKLDFSELPALIAAFAFGPVSGATVCLVKNLVNVLFTTTGGVDRPNAPVITGKEHTVGDIITKVEPETGVDKFIENLAVSNGTAKVFTADGQAKTSGHIATGDILRLYSGETLCASYPVVIYGDVNGDGKITSLDLRITQKHILGVDKLEGYILTAADTGKDGNVTSLDLRVTQKHILGITKTLQ